MGDLRDMSLSNTLQSLLVIGIATMLAAPAGAAAQEISVGEAVRGAVRSLGTVSLSTGASSIPAMTLPERGAAIVEPWMFDRKIKPPESAALLPRIFSKSVVKLPKLKHSFRVQDDSSMHLGFDGLDGYDSWKLNPISGASTPGNLELEPPDQALCVGGGYVMEAVNDALIVYSASTNQIAAGPVSLYDAMDVSLAAHPAGCILNSTCTIDELADPRCMYDSGNFYVTATHIKYDGSESDLRLLVLPAGSTTGAAYLIPTTQGGLFEDQPLLGADANNIYISGNSFSISSNPRFEGAEIFAVPKSDLTTFEILVPTDAASISPAVSPGGDYDTDNGGTEFFLISNVGATTPQKKVEILALIGTCAVPSPGQTPGCPFSYFTMLRPSKAYAVPPFASEMSGPNPLGQSLGVSTVPRLDTGDQRMQQVVYTGGKLYGALTTAIAVGGQIQSGILWLEASPKLKVKPRKSGPPRVKAQARFKSGYIAASGYDLLYPSIAVLPAPAAANSAGVGLVAFDISGASIFPSVGYAKIFGAADRSIHIVVDGVGPDDGFTAYPQFTNGPSDGIGRWGDYTATSVDESGNFWFAGEYIAQNCDSSEYSSDDTCGGTRSPHTNWATHITEINP
jgi:hypothetical protein